LANEPLVKIGTARDQLALKATFYPVEKLIRATCFLIISAVGVNEDECFGGC